MTSSIKMTPLMYNTVPSDVSVFHPITPLSQRSKFWRPAYLEQSAWVEHIPFAFWLVEVHRPRVFVELGAHYGVSYFAFCQAVERLGLCTQCYAVDTWKGDEHAGHYDERVFEKVKYHNNAHYSGFSTLVRSSFDDASKHFEDGSIDLLHIDGLHTLEAVRHDFETWLPKLSRHAIVIMHDTNVRERGFGVFKLFSTLKQQYPHFEFIHGHGLGVLGIGDEQSELIHYLFEANATEHLRKAIHEVFSRLGSACADSLAITKYQERATKLAAEVEKTKLELNETKSQLAAEVEKTKLELNETKSQLAAEIEKTKLELNEAKSQHYKQIAQFSVESGHHAMQISQLQDQLTELKNEVSRLNAHNEIYSNELVIKDREMASLEVEHKKLKSEQKLNAKSLEDRFRELATLTKMLEERDREVMKKNNTIKKERERISFLKNTLSWKLTAPVRAIARPFKKTKKGSRAIKSQIKLIEQSDLFDTSWYLSRYPDVADNGTNPVEHYVRYGATEGRSPSPKFDSQWYLSTYTDVADSGLNPLFHYIKYGKYEGRKPYQPLLNK